MRREPNRLARESSPYLLQHAYNPVDWFAWGPEAFEKARREDKPIFLSVGYSTCHWCHVMERESFENDEIARLLNDRFVPVKVDREERPDVDQVYMAAVQAISGRGGWPMSLFLLPDGKPFWGGTYFPPDDRSGKAGFKTILGRIAELHRTQRNDVLQGADELTQHLRGLGAAAATTAEIGADTLAKGHQLFAQQFDARHGGFGGAPKFPRPHALSFLLRQWRRSRDDRTLVMVEVTLDRMARGGMYDHLGGGFHRYATDAEWRVPHFEKMLYDQALLARTYLEAWQVTGKEPFAAVARDVFRYVLRDLAHPQGGFLSAEDADSEGVEGKFYVWTAAELEHVLGAADAVLFARVYGVAPDGNYREEATNSATGANILHLPLPVREVARALAIEPALFAARLAGLREKLFAVRERRVRPHRDDKVLTDWNGLMIGALACGGNALDEARYTEAARRAAVFVLEALVRDGRLLHRFRAGQAGIPAYLDDYAFLGLGLLDLYEATFEVRWLREAKRWAEEMVRLFWDNEGKGFRFSGRDGEQLVAQTKEVYDGAVPSGNSAAALLLLRVGRLTMDAALQERGHETLRAFSAQLDELPVGFPFLLQALDFAVGPAQEIVLAGEPGDAGLAAMRRAVARRFLPNKVVALHPGGEAGREIQALVPFLAEQRAVGGCATAYVCEGYACSLPVTEPAQLEARLDAR